MSDKFAHLDIPESACSTFGALTLRPYQQAGHDAVIAHVKSSHDPSVVSASVGAGKTTMIAALCRHVSDRNGRTMVLSRQGEIVEQDAEDAWLAECKNSIFCASLSLKSVAYPTIFGSEGTVWRSLENDLKYWVGAANGLTPYGQLSEEDMIKSKPDPEEKVKLSPLSNYRPDLLIIDECHMVDFMEEDSQYMRIISELYRRNPKLKVVGYTGTPYRGVIPIVGEAKEYFWKKQLIEVPTEYLTDLGYLTPCTFGFAQDPSGQYDLSEFHSSSEDGTQDFTAAELRQMEDLMLKAETTTEKIMIEVMRRTKDRNCVMITCAGKRHCKEAAKFLPEGSFAIITEDMGARRRKAALKAAFNGEIKYLLQVGCLTTGLNIPLIDTIVILRKISSLTLLVQLIGRGLRLLKDFQIAAGIKKEDCLVLDYSDTLTELHSLYENPILEEADLSRSIGTGSTQTCPKCGAENGEHAVRCIGDDGGQRCDYFFSSRECGPTYIGKRLVNEGCGAQNAPTARECRICGNTLIDPNAKLSGKHYTNADLLPVLSFKMIPCRNEGILVKYSLPGGEVATKFYSPWSTNKIAKRIWRAEFLKNHALTPEAVAAAKKAKNAKELCSKGNLFNVIECITHRVNGDGKSVIAKYQPKPLYMSANSN